MSKIKKMGVFHFITALVALLVLLFIGSAVLAIIIKGSPDFLEAVKSEEVRFSMFLSVETATCSTCICMLLALCTAYALTHVDMPLKKLTEVLLELTISIPYILLGLSLLVLFSTQLGDWLKEIGIQVVFTPLGIIMAQLIVNLPFCIRLLRTSLLDVNPRLEFISYSLGASPFRSFITVILPLCRNAIISIFILTWSRALGEFGATLMLVGVTRMKTETLPGCIYLNISTGNNSVAMATAILVLFISGLALLVSNLLTKSVQKTRADIY